MQVIGKTKGKYLIEASEDEIANLFGHYSRYDKVFEVVKNKHNDSKGYLSDKSLVGLEIHVTEAYNQLSWLKRRQSDFDGLCKKLEETKEAIQSSKPLFTRITGEDQ